MSIIWHRLLEIRDGTFEFFDEVYLFGSSLAKINSEDIDLILVYRREQDLREVAAARQSVVDSLCLEWDGRLIDATVLSDAELAQTRILERIRHKKIKGKST